MAQELSGYKEHAKKDRKSLKKLKSKSKHKKRRADLSNNDSDSSWESGSSSDGDVRRGKTYKLSTKHKDKNLEKTKLISVKTFK